MATKTVTLLDPTSKAREKKLKMAVRPDNLEGKVVGFLLNSKPNGNLLLLRTKELLSQKFRIASTNWLEKPEAGIPATADTMDELTRTADLVINAVGD